MPKTLSDTLYSFASGSHPVAARARCTARDLDLPEAWFRDAIFASPNLVMDACRVAGVTDDEWYPWAKEFRTEVGPIDVLLVSAQGRVGIVETKLASNPEARRKVLAQTLDYLAHLADAFDEEMPPLPIDSDGRAVAELDDVRQAVADGDVLLIIASDDIDERAAKLSQSLITDNIVKGWELALVDLALFRASNDEGRDVMVVPTVRNIVFADTRQVIRVVVDGAPNGASVQLDRQPIAAETVGRRSWDEARFFEGLPQYGAPRAVQELARRAADLAKVRGTTLELGWGTGREGSMLVKRRGKGLLEIFGSGALRVRPGRFAAALGEEAAGKYRQGLAHLAPGPMQMDYPLIRPQDAAAIASDVFALLTAVLEDADRAER